MPDTYDPGRLLDALRERCGLKNDAALAHALDVSPPILSKIRHLKMPVGASLLLRAHELPGLPCRELRDLMGDRRAKFRQAGRVQERMAA